MEIWRTTEYVADVVDNVEGKCVAWREYFQWILGTVRKAKLILTGLTRRNRLGSISWGYVFSFVKTDQRRKSKLWKKVRSSKPMLGKVRVGSWCCAFRRGSAPPAGGNEAIFSDVCGENLTGRALHFWPKGTAEVELWIHYEDLRPPMQGLNLRLCSDGEYLKETSCYDCGR